MKMLTITVIKNVKARLSMLHKIQQDQKGTSVDNTYSVPSKKGTLFFSGALISLWQ